MNTLVWSLSFCLTQVCIISNSYWTFITLAKTIPIKRSCMFMGVMSQLSLPLSGRNWTGSCFNFKISAFHIKMCYFCCIEMYLTNYWATILFIFRCVSQFWCCVFGCENSWEVICNWVGSHLDFYLLAVYLCQVPMTCHQLQCNAMPVTLRKALSKELIKWSLIEACLKVMVPPGHIDLIIIVWIFQMFLVCSIQTLWTSFGAM